MRSFSAEDAHCGGVLHDVYALLAEHAVALQAIVRPRLIDALLERIEQQRITFIQGPSGSGKSVLVEQAMQALAPAAQTALLSLTTTHTTRGSMRPALLSLLSRFSLAGKRQPFVIFIDDADELLRDETAALEQCLSSFAPEGRLVIASRNPIRLTGVTPAQGADRRLLLADLLFTRNELAQALRCADEPLNAAQLETIWRFSEGWPAVIALLQASHPQDGALDIECLLRDWLQEEILDAMEPSLRAFTLDASTVPSLEAPMLDAMRGQPTSNGLLARLAQEHDLLIDNRSRFPRPVWSTLQSLHRDSAPQRVRELHRAAVEIQLDNNKLEAALEHAYQMGDRQLLRHLLERHEQTLLCEGRMRPLVRWLGALQREGHLAEAPQLQLALAWSLLFLDDQQAAVDIVLRLRHTPLSADQCKAVQALAFVDASMHDQIETWLDHAELWLDGDSDNPFAQHIHNCTVALARLVSGDLARVEGCLETVSDEQAGVFVSDYARSIRAMVYLLRGEAHNAHRLLQQPVTQAGRGNSLVVVLDALSRYERGHADEVVQLLELHMPLLRHTGLLDQIILAYQLRARIHMAQGESQQALGVLDALECLGREGRLGRMVFCARLERVRCTLVRGEVALARSLLEPLRDDDLSSQLHFLSGDTHSWGLMDARVQLAEGGAASLPDELTQQLEQALAMGRLRRALTLRILLAQALEQCGNEAAALRSMTAALEFAAPRQLLQPLRDEGHGALLLALRAAQASASLGEFAEQLVVGTGVQLPDNSAGLTAKELQVLTLVAGGQRNDALAAKLFVSESTVRTHLRNINAKLNARSRLEALAIARRNGLIAS